ncbi:hypothetical protein J2Y45_006035 [Dyadobacter sp. BE34]|uniref:DUF998 domain-containing protein n=1 Tax=Dyadobacter fermentans TaxID=94254 RepID=A0ABU1R642_9BACT|nr:MULTISPECIES: hypothetical protein [Dyadobacter]MDR6808823.1 hypothetical protein [Dyadobacter fermentans]MDR7046566.1 hypothetical protein [Dyadobacter sp. BE242]MDR7200879.1 hypothetical protein [Dyadobacter sp. BE34]MDR7218840.1 hypothetical protein [Dyadobacter sp. BE31]MDR7266769.1 hypothetical protein [Dyadobacter sp. BE32]
MAKKNLPQKHDILNLDYETEPDKVWLTKQETLRKLVGFLGVSLPPVLYLFVLGSSGYDKPLDSISHYYYTRWGSLLVIIVSLLAIFLLIYKGKELIDFILSTVAGTGALLLLLLPTSNISDPSVPEKVGVTHLVDNPVREAVHYGSAALFLVSLAIMSIFLFPRVDNTLTKMKKVRNKFYVGFGILMILALLVIYPGQEIIPDIVYDKHHLTFWMEALAVEFFGASWLIKGGVFLQD